MSRSTILQRVLWGVLLITVALALPALRRAPERRNPYLHAANARTPSAPTPGRPDRAFDASEPLSPQPESLPTAMMDYTGQPVWQDPSLDPETLARAFAPPPPPSTLPPEARPKAPAITPPARDWHQLQREDQAVAD